MNSVLEEHKRGIRQNSSRNEIAKVDREIGERAKETRIIKQVGDASVYKVCLKQIKHSCSYSSRKGTWGYYPQGRITCHTFRKLPGRGEDKRASKVEKEG